MFSQLYFQEKPSWGRRRLNFNKNRIKVGGVADLGYIGRRWGLISPTSKIKIIIEFMGPWGHG